VSTGSEGHTFIKIDAGMTEARDYRPLLSYLTQSSFYLQILRPSLYGAVHPISILRSLSSHLDDPADAEEYIVVSRDLE
jgi:hypothetical protein